MNRVRRGAAWRRLLGVLVVALVASFAGEASAAQIGATGLAGLQCFPGEQGGATGFAVPAGGGLITSFSIASQAADTGAVVDFLVFRATGGSSYLVVGKTGAVTLTGSGFETFPANIPVQAGDFLGFWIGSGLVDCGTFGGPGDVFSATAGNADPNAGATVVLPQPRGGFSLNESASLVPALTCQVTAVRRTNPAQQDVTVQTPVGLAAITNIQISNGTVNVPAFIRGTTAPVVITATKIDQTMKTRWSFDATDTAGNVTHCA